jgi:DNA-binding MarR family transcriptional regulator
MFYRKITEDIIKLKPKEAVTYLALALKSDYQTLKSSVNEETLAEDLGIDVRTIKRHIKKFKDMHLIEVDTKYLYKQGNTIKKNYYQLSTNHYDFVEIRKLLNLQIDLTLKGFLAILNSLCKDCEGKTWYSASEMADKLVIGKRSIEQYLKEAEDLGYISRNCGEIELLNKDIFIPSRKTDKRLCMEIYQEAFSEDDFDAIGHYKGN